MPLYMKMSENINETMRHLKFCYILILTTPGFHKKLSKECLLVIQ